MSFRKSISSLPGASHEFGQSWAVLFFLYAYGTLHFAFAIPSIFGFQDRGVVVALHLYSTPVILKVFALLLWTGALLVLVVKLASAKSGKPALGARSLIRIFWLLGMLATVWLGILIAPNFRGGAGLPTNWLELKGATSAVATWATALVGALALLSDSRNQRSTSALTFRAVGPLLMGLVIVVSAVALAELWTGLAYASETRGPYIASRASSTLFNPNVLGLWAAFTTIGVAMLYCENAISTKVMRTLHVLLAFVILSSGSRSAFIPLLAGWLLLIAGLGFGNRARLRLATSAGLTWSISLASFSLMAHASAVIGAHGNLIESLIWNSNRLFGSFSVVFVYVLSMLVVLPDGWAVLPENAQMSMDGRFTAGGAATDNDYLAILHGGGWGALAMWLSLWLFVAARSLTGFWRTRHHNFIYAGVLIVLAVMSGLGMRATQLFPVSIFVAITLAWALFLTEHKLSSSTTTPPQ